MSTFVYDRRVRFIGFALGVVSAAVVSLAPALAEAADATPFKGTFTERSTVTACPSGSPAALVCFTGAGSGHATHLGRAGESLTAAVDTSRTDPKTGCAPVTAKATLTAANGDRLFLVSSGVACLGGAHPTNTGTYQFTGGTGRFENAGGSGTINTVGTVNADGSVSSTTTYSGTLSRH